MKRKTIERINKFLHLLVALVMVIQPVGTPGLLVAVAADTLDNQAEVTAAPEPDPAPAPKEEPAPAPAPEPTPTPDPVPTPEPTPAPVVEPEIPSAPAVEEPAIPADEPTDAATEETVTEATPPAEGTDSTSSPQAPDGAGAPAEQPTEEPAASETMSETPVAEDTTGETCLADGANIENSQASDWEVNGDVAKTKEDVKLGVKYQFPLDEKVSVTFTCLPKDESKISALKIERVRTAELNLSGMDMSVAEYAYDITTEMEDGDFEYDLVLPKPENKTAGVSYIEKTVAEARTDEITPNEIAKVENNNIEQKTSGVEASDLNHFTIFLVTWNFPNNPDNAIADGGTATNLAKTITAIGTNAPTFDTSGDTTNSARATGWDNGSGSKYWQVEFDSTGYSNIKLSAKQRSSSNGPRDFKVQYKIGSGGSWTDISGGTILAANNYTTGTVANLSLPLAVDDQASVYLRWIMTSNTAVNNNPTNSNGASNIDDIIVLGDSLSSIIPLNITPVANLCTNDVDGANDQPGQKDLTKMCITSDKSQILFNWDEIVGGGNNTYDGCSLWDSDDDGNANYALCVSVLANQSTDVMEFSGFTLYSCGDDRSDRCSQPVNVNVPSQSTECEASQKNTDPFAAGAAYPQDTEGICNINTNDIGGGVLLNVCSFPSGQPNSDPSDCIAREEGGFITIVKDADPNDSTVFNFSISGASNYSDAITGSGTGTRFSVATGTFSVSETVPSGWSLDNAVCVDQNQASKGTFSGNAVSGIVVGDGSDITCTFTDSLAQGMLTVIKDLIPSNDPGLFNLQIDGTTYASNVGDGGTTGAQTLSAGNYTVGETAGNGTNLSDYTVTIGGACDANGNVSIAGGDNKTCTITNTRNTGSVKVNKIADTDGNGTFETTNPVTFNWSLDGNGTNAMGATVSGVNTGNHSVDENTVTNYHPVGWYPGGVSSTQYSCTNLPEATAYHNLPASISVTKDTTTEITICNVRDTGNLKAQKIVDDQSDLTQWSFALDGGGTVSADSNGLVDFGQVTTDDTHTIVEQGPTGYHFVQVSGLNCVDNQDGSADATVSYGGTTLCTFSNAVDKASITIIKDAVPDSDQDFGFTTTGGLIPPSFTLDDNGNNNDGTSNTQTFSGLFPGTYSVTETGVSGWDLGPIQCSSNNQSLAPINGNTFSRTLVAGESVTCTFTNTKQGSIVIIKNTLGGDDTFDFTSGTLGAFSLTTVAGTDQTTFDNLDVDTTYDVAETVPTGWELNNATCDNGETIDSIDLEPGETVTCTFANTKLGHIIVDKVTNPSQLGPIFQTFNFAATGGTYADFSLTDQDAPNDQELIPGTYSVSEILPLDDWQLDSVACTLNQLPTGNDITNGKEIALGAGETVYCTFANTQLSDVHGYKWDDINQDGIPNGAEPKLSGWEIFIDENDNSLWDDGEQKTTTSIDQAHLGWYWFENLLPGEYKICEVQQNGWTQTYPTPSCHTLTLPEGESTCSSQESENAVSTDQECNFGNQFTEPSLTITKSNNKYPVDQVPGAIVTYTLTVTANNNDVLVVKVTDLPPAGFIVDNGSASTDQGFLENEYHSPGVWNLGNMAAGQTVTLSYNAKISGSQDPGLYNDLAWAEGESEIGTGVLASSAAGSNPADDGIINENFVGTKVAIVVSETPRVELEEDTETRTRTRTRRVLAATGANFDWTLLALGFIAAGAGLFLIKKKKVKNMKAANILMLAVLSGSLVILTPSAQAVTNLTVQMEDPADFTDTPNFKIGFVTLDILGQGINIHCLKQGPLDGGFVEYDSATLAGGGTSGNCDVNAAALPVDGSYDFKVTADTASDSAVSATETVVMDSIGPDTPEDYDRNNDSCTVTFHTANDGQTAKVELYRSTETDFIADSSTFSTFVNIGPNTDGSITDPLGNCGDYFYAIRAVDANGNGSGFVGDEDVNVRTRTRTRTITEGTTGAIPVTGGAVAGAAAGEQGAVEGVETQGGQEGSVLGEETAEAPQPEGLGAMFKKYWPWLLILAGVIIVLYGIFRKKGNQNNQVQ